MATSPVVGVRGCTSPDRCTRRKSSRPGNRAVTEAAGHTGAMAGITVSGLTIDSAEPEKLAAWWAEALGWSLDGRSCRAPGDGLQRPECMAVPDAKRVKNRAHDDFGADDAQA